MLTGIPALFGPELRAMGHSDEIALVDENHPAEGQAHRLIRADGHHRAPGLKVVALTGADFYLQVRSAHAIAAASEPRLDANIIIRKDVVYPPENRKS